VGLKGTLEVARRGDIAFVKRQAHERGSRRNKTIVVGVHVCEVNLPDQFKKVGDCCG
jgi:hypothetical protein